MNWKTFFKRLLKAFWLLIKDIFKGLKSIGKGMVERERTYLKKHPEKRQEPLVKFQVPESEFKNFGKESQEAFKKGKFGFYKPKKPKTLREMW